MPSGAVFGGWSTLLPLYSEPSRGRDNWAAAIGRNAKFAGGKSAITFHSIDYVPKLHRADPRVQNTNPKRERGLASVLSATSSRRNVR